MDGLKKRLKRSVQLRLSVMLAVAVTLMALASAAFAFLNAFHDARESQDDVLYQIAALVHQQQLELADAQTYHLEDDDNDSVVIVRPLGLGESGGAATHAPEFPDTLHDGLHTLHLPGQTLRTLVRTAPNGQRFAVAQTTATRDARALAGALRTLLPFALLLPVLLLLIGHLVRTLFRPITTTAAQIDARTERDLEPVPEHALPLEVRPFVHAINGLLARVAESAATQRRFIADAAHELRTPLAALSLQAERLEQTDMSAVARERLTALRAGIQRAGNLVNQLLALSRTQAHALVPGGDTAPLQQTLREVLEGLMPLAAAQDIDVGVTASCDAHVHASTLDLSTLIKNLVDNAIRYTPAGGRVDIACVQTGRAVTLTVVDTGPGIPPAVRQRVFEPFYRTHGSEQIGSGLGLTIVHNIVKRLGGRITLDWADAAAHTGLRVTVTLVAIPLSAAPGLPDAAAPAATGAPD